MKWADSTDGLENFQRDWIWAQVKGEGGNKEDPFGLGVKQIAGVGRPTGGAG